MVGNSVKFKIFYYNNYEKIPDNEDFTLANSNMKKKMKKKVE